MCTARHSGRANAGSRDGRGVFERHPGMHWLFSKVRGQIKHRLCKRRERALTCFTIAMPVHVAADPQILPPLLTHQSHPISMFCSRSLNALASQAKPTNPWLSPSAFCSLLSSPDLTQVRNRLMSTILADQTPAMANTTSSPLIAMVACVSDAAHVSSTRRRPVGFFQHQQRRHGRAGTIRRIQAETGRWGPGVQGCHLARSDPPSWWVRISKAAKASPLASARLCVQCARA